MTDTGSSASRQHYVETGHYGDWTTPGGWVECSWCDGGCTCTPDPDTGELHDVDGWPCSHRP
jgi:hypothetical protein